MVSTTTATQVSASIISLFPLLLISTFIFIILLPLIFFLNKLLHQVYFNRLKNNMEKHFEKFIPKKDNKKIFECCCCNNNKKNIGSLEEWI
jgi:hypothetical protein